MVGTSHAPHVNNTPKAIFTILVKINWEFAIEGAEDEHWGKGIEEYNKVKENHQNELYFLSKRVWGKLQCFRNKVKSWNL